MRAVLRPLAAALLLIAGPVASACAAAAPDEPVKLVRTLQMLQDQIAHGTLESEGQRRTLIEAIGTRLLAAPPETWSDPRNVDAALLYVLSGGNPAVLDKAPAGEDAVHAALVAAVRAYATGSEEDAKKLWAPIDLATLPIGLVGPSALAKATLLTEDDPKQAMQFVDIARLESPGTLIEEAAVRRGIEIAAKLGDGERFEFFATRYASRFPRSMYGEAFRHRFSEFYLAIAAQKDGETTPKLETILAPLSDDDRRAIFLEIARLAIVAGKTGLAQAAAENAASLAWDGSVEMRRADLYRAIALAVGDDPSAARTALQAIDRDALPDGDRELLASALSVVDAVQHWPEVGAAEPPPVDPPDAAAEGGGASDGPALLARAHAAVEAAKKLLSDGGA